MPKRVLVVESPGKVQKLSQILESEWIVRASCGHIRELSDEGEDSLGFVMDGNSVQRIGNGCIAVSPFAASKIRNITAKLYVSNDGSNLTKKMFSFN